MVLKLLRFANIFVSGLNAGISLSHALQAPQKAKLNRQCFVAVQQKLYIRYGRAARVLEPAALASSLAIATLRRRRRLVSLPMVASAGCTVAEIVVWAKMIDPINRTIWQWDEDNPRSDWTLLGHRWHALHRVRTVLYCIAFGA
jgi:hypothetical protein